MIRTQDTADLDPDGYNNRSRNVKKTAAPEGSGAKLNAATARSRNDDTTVRYPAQPHGDDSDDSDDDNKDDDKDHDSDTDNTNDDTNGHKGKKDSNDDPGASRIISQLQVKLNAILDTLNVSKKYAESTQDAIDEI